MPLAVPLMLVVLVVQKVLPEPRGLRMILLPLLVTVLRMFGAARWVALRPPWQGVAHAVPQPAPSPLVPWAAAAAAAAAAALPAPQPGIPARAPGAP
jgi:hypothetical protein